MAEEKVFEIVRRHFRKAPALERSTRFREDLGADSLDLVALIYEFEQELGVAIPDREAAALQTVGDAVRRLEEGRP